MMPALMSRTAATNIFIAGTLAPKLQEILTLITYLIHKADTEHANSSSACQTQSQTPKQNYQNFYRIYFKSGAESAKM